MKKYFIYVIQADNKRRYIGITQDLEKRMHEHAAGKSYWTARYKGWQLIYQEVHPNISSARKRELYLKSLKGGATFKKIINIPNQKIS